MDDLDFIELARTPIAIALTIVVALVYPLIGYLRFRALGRLKQPWGRRVKLALYATIVGSQWTLVLATALVLRSAGGSLADVGQRTGNTGATLLACAILLGGFAVISTVTLPRLSQITAGELPSHVALAGRILPTDGFERAAFVAAALTAGLCEEILYRGWLPLSFGALTGSPGLGFALAALAFGLGHAYQGRNGMILTGALGLFLGAVVAWSGSLIPGQILHVAIDLVNGIAVGRVMRRLRGASIDASAAGPVESGSESTAEARSTSES